VAPNGRVPGSSGTTTRTTPTDAQRETASGIAFVAGSSVSLRISLRICENPAWSQGRVSISRDRSSPQRSHAATAPGEKPAALRYRAVTSFQRELHASTEATPKKERTCGLRRASDSTPLPRRSSRGGRAAPGSGRRGAAARLAWVGETPDELLSVPVRGRSLGVSPPAHSGPVLDQFKAPFPPSRTPGAGCRSAG